MCRSLRHRRGRRLRLNRRLESSPAAFTAAQSYSQSRSSRHAHGCQNRQAPRNDGMECGVITRGLATTLTAASSCSSDLVFPALLPRARESGPSSAYFLRLLGNGNSLAGNLPTMQTPSFSQSMSQEWPISRPGEMLTSNIENWNSQDMSSMPQQAENHLIPPLFQQEPGGTFSGRNVSGSFIPGTLTRQSSLTGEYIPPAAVYPAGAGKESYPATVPYSGLEYGDSNSQSDVTEYQTSSEYGDYPRRRASKRHRTARSSATQFSGMPLSSPAYQPYPSQPPHAHAPPSIPYQQYPQPPYAESTSAVSPPLAADTDELSATARLAAAKAMQLAEERKRRGHSTAGSRSLPPGALEILREVSQIHQDLYFLSRHRFP